jgi:AcrR family transcriptional regulator
LLTRIASASLDNRGEVATRLTQAIEKVDDPRRKILAVFDAQAQQYRQPDFNGCAFIAASTEAPSGGLVEQAADQFRAWIRAMFIDLAEQAGAPDPASLGRQLHFIYDGTGLAGHMDHHDARIAPAARDAVQALLDAALAQTRPRAKRH